MISLNLYKSNFAFDARNTAYDQALFPPGPVSPASGRLLPVWQTALVALPAEAEKLEPEAGFA